MDVRDKQNIKSRYEGRVKGGSFDFIILNDNNTGLVIEFFYGLFVTDISMLYSTDNTITLNWNKLYQFNEFGMSLETSTDNEYILVGARSGGIYLFSISNNEINILEKIPGDHL